MRPLDFSHVTPSFSDGIELSPTRNNFLAREKTRARMHDIRTEFLVRVYRTSFLDGELGSSVMGLTVLTLPFAMFPTMVQQGLLPYPFTYQKRPSTTLAY